MTDVLFIMRFDIAFAGIRHFELPLYQKIRAGGISAILLSFEHGLVVVAGDRGRYGVCLKPHCSRDPCQREGSIVGLSVRSELAGLRQATSKRVLGYSGGPLISPTAVRWGNSADLPYGCISGTPHTSRCCAAAAPARSNQGCAAANCLA